MKKHMAISIVLVTIVGMVFLLNNTNPTEAGPLGVLAFFVLFYGMFFGLSLGILSTYRRMTGVKNINRQKDHLYALIIGFGPVILLLMKAFGFLNVFAIILAILFVLLGCFLVKNKFNVVK